MSSPLMQATDLRKTFANGLFLQILLPSVVLLPAMVAVAAMEVEVVVIQVEVAVVVLADQ